eukprot:COSAG06_NODE_2189_length_7384_cov_1.396980_8_plen_105_part_00
MGGATQTPLDTVPVVVTVCTASTTGYRLAPTSTTGSNHWLAAQRRYNRSYSSYSSYSTYSTSRGPVPQHGGLFAAEAVRGSAWCAASSQWKVDLTPLARWGREG